MFKSELPSAQMIQGMDRDSVAWSIVLAASYFSPVTSHRVCALLLSSHSASSLCNRYLIYGLRPY